MNRAALMAEAKAKAGLTKDVELARALGVGRSFLSLVKSGAKNIPSAMVDKLNQMINGGSDGLPLLPDVQRSAGHELGVLPSQAPDQPAAGTAGDAAGADQGDGGQGGGQPADWADQPREGKAQGRAAVVVGQTYFPKGSAGRDPSKKSAAHTHRRVLGIVDRPGRSQVVAYSNGGNTNHLCNIDTFKRWMDHGQPKIKLVGAGAKTRVKKAAKADNQPYQAGAGTAV